MTTYYVSPAASGGSDSNNGLGPDASHATNKPYATVGKAMKTGAAVLPGDTVWLGPGILYEGANTVTPIAAIASAASPTQFIGDPSNSQGFKTAGGVRVDPALPVWTPRTTGVGQDGNQSSTSTFIAANTNAVKGVQFKNFKIEAYVGAVLLLLDYACTDWLVQDMMLYSQVLIQCGSGTPTAARNWTLRRVEYVGTLLQIGVNVAAATADANLAILAEKCRGFGPLTGNLALAASGGNLAGGIAFKGCRAFDPQASLIRTTAARVSTVTPITLEGCDLHGSAALNVVNPGTSGHVIDNGYNVIHGPVANFTIAGTSQQNSLPHLNWMSRRKWGLDLPRRNFLGWSPEATTAQKFSGWSDVTSDFSGRTPSPWGAGPSIGDSQSVNVALASGKAQLTGAGEVSLHLYLPAAGTYTISVLTDSTSYGGTNYPQLIIEPIPSVGLTQQIGTATDGTSQTISNSVTVSGAAFVEARMISRSTSVSSTTRFDNLTRV